MGARITDHLGHDGYGNNFSTASTSTGTLPSSMNNFSLANPLTNNLLPVTTTNGGTINAIYDLYGELTQMTTGVSSGQYLDLTWDPLGRLETLYQTQTGATETYQYSPSGLRVARTDSRDTSQNRFYGYAANGKLLTEYTTAHGLAKTQALVAKGILPGPEVMNPTNGTISAPVTGTHVKAGTALQFTGSSTNSTSFLWTFGDGTTSTTSSTTHTYATVGTYSPTLTCYCSTCGTPSLLVGGITIYVDANAPPPVPVIASFTPNPATVVPGYSTTLSWSVQGATTLQVTPTLGTVTGTSATVAPASTTTYQLTATNVTGSTSATATVIVAGTGVPVWKRDIIYLGGVAIAEIDANGLHELHCDALGTPRLITNAAGVVEGAQTFGPYGETLSAWGYAPITGYTGHLQAEPSGLIYMRGRFYSPAWHRFLNGDQGVDPNQMNQFAYVGGRPFAGVDPSGMLALSPEQAKLGNYIANAKAYDSLDGPNLPDLYFMLTMANQNPLLLPSQLSNLATVAQWAPASTIDAVDEFGNNASYEQPGFWYFAVQAQTSQNAAWDRFMEFAGNVAGGAGAVGGALSLAGKAPGLARALGGPEVAAIGTTADILNPNASAATTGLNAFYNGAAFTGPLGTVLSIQWFVFSQYPGGPAQAATDGAYGGSLNCGVPGVAFGRSYR